MIATVDTAEAVDLLLELQLRIQRTAEPGLILAIAWEGGYLTPGQRWATPFVSWAELRRHLAEVAGISQKTLHCAEKRFSQGIAYDIPMKTRISDLRRMGFHRQTA